MHSLVPTFLVTCILHFLPLMKTLKIVFIFTEIFVLKKEKVDLCFLYLSVAMMGGAVVMQVFVCRIKT